jgi:hypothetical protein
VLEAASTCVLTFDYQDGKGETPTAPRSDHQAIAEEIVVKPLSGLECLCVCRTSILELSENEATYEHLIARSQEGIDLQVAVRAKTFRTAESDRVWSQRTVRRLREAERHGNAVVRGVRSERAARSIGWDLHDPAEPRIGSPGGPVWRLNDWVQYPRTVLQIEACWSDLDFLYFDEMRDQWYYRITQDDLQRTHLSLREFADPIYHDLTALPDFTRLLSEGANLSEPYRPSEPSSVTLPVFSGNDAVCLLCYGQSVPACVMMIARPIIISG